MGVFDTIHCERPLPDGCREQEFQTKSLDCGMETYRLTVQGRLLNAAGLDTGFHGVMRFYTHTPAGQWYDAADLDFGIYRVLNNRRATGQSFLREPACRRLLPQRCWRSTPCAM